VSQNLKTRTGPDGLHMFNRATGVNVLVDEIAVPMTEWSAAPRHVSVALTNACDLRCPHCYAPKGPGKLEVGRVAVWLKELDSNGCLGVGFGGGEPTLHPDFVSLCRFVANDTGLAVTFTTHAHRLTNDVAAALKGQVNFVRVSMDGVGSTYEKLRGKRFDLFVRQLETVRALAPFGINVVVNALTFPDLDEAVKLAIESGATELLLLPERPTHAVGGIDDHTRHQLRHWVRTFKGAIRLAVSEADAAGFPTCDPLPKETGLRSYAHIDALGTLRKSSFDEIGVPIGSKDVMVVLAELERISGRVQ
jgi:MoaA/NifB/PqqE/SkfB family radical SAM enzyme